MKLLRQILGPLLALCFALAPAEAASPGQKATILNGVQSWAPPGSSFVLNFARNGGSCAVYRIAKSCGSPLTTVRASTEMAPWSDQHWTSFASGAPAITDLGLSVWAAATNTALRSRDLTQAAWVAVNMTTALTATGIDNTANAATKLTATAGNATVLQTLTIGSTAETFSIFVERVTGTGNIQITENNGSTWTTMSASNCVNTQGVGTAINATTFVRCSVEAVLANPVIGVRIVTNGDSVAVDVAQNEANTFATPPIVTTSSSATRAADAVTAALGSWFNASAGTYVTQFITTVPNTGNAAVAGFDDGTTNNQMYPFTSGTALDFFMRAGSSVRYNIASGVTLVNGATNKVAMAYGATPDFGAINGGSTQSLAQTGLPTGLNRLTLGFSAVGGDVPLNGLISSFTYYPVRKPNAQVTALTP